MRLTCLKCGHQFQVSVVDAQLEGYGYCLCGTEHVFPDVITPGIFPSDRAAEISRTRISCSPGRKGYWGLGI